MWLRIIGVTAAFLGIASTAFAADALPKLPAGSHYRFTARFISVNEMSPDDRLQGACDAAEQLRDSLKGQKLKSDATSELNVLHALVCGSSYKPVSRKPHP